MSFRSILLVILFGCTLQSSNVFGMIASQDSILDSCGRRLAAIYPRYIEKKYKQMKYVSNQRFVAELLKLIQIHFELDVPRSRYFIHSSFPKTIRPAPPEIQGNAQRFSEWLDTKGMKLIQTFPERVSRTSPLEHPTYYLVWRKSKKVPVGIIRFWSFPADEEDAEGDYHPETIFIFEAFAIDDDMNLTLVERWTQQWVSIAF